MNDVLIQFGLETEIGIDRDAEGEIDVVAESIALVRSVAGPGVRMKWDYESEDPHADARGFHVQQLRQDTDEANYYAADAARELSYTEIKSDVVLGNGARLYNDHAHPEYCTPECSTVEELVAHDRAGERILMACAAKLATEQGRAVRLYKNNTDFFGHSYGCHENYLLPRSLEWDALARGMQAFLVTRQVFAGAGKFGVEAEDRFVSPGFQLSQRADFFSELQSVDTMQKRPLINTRDEPHADPRKWRRFHVILGDANMSPFATRLKVGSTALVLEALVRDPGVPLPVLADPLGALPAISRDRKWKWEVKLQGHRAATALSVQRLYLGAVKGLCDLSSPEKTQLVADWEAVLDDLEADPLRCRDRLDWVAKFALLREFQSAENVADDDPWLRSLDLAYHLLDPEHGLYFGLERAGLMRGVPSEAAVLHAVQQPPRTTRAYVRGRCVQKFGAAVQSAQWDHVTLQGCEWPLKISLLDLFASDEVLRYGRAVDAAGSPDELRTLLSVKR
jgi:proteasome accessory factor PafA2